MCKPPVGLIPLLLLALTLSLPAAAADGSPLLLPGPGGAGTRHHRVLPFKPVRLRHVLALGEQITCAGGCAVQLDDGSRVVLEPRAIAEVSSPLYFRFAGAPMATRCAVVQLDEGGLGVTHPAFVRRPLVVRTATALVAIEHGHALLRTLPDRTVVVVREGRAAARTGRTWRPLAAGQAHTVGGATVRSRPIMVAPAWQRGGSHQRAVGLAVHGPKAIVELGWRAVPGADGYRLQIAPTPRFAQIASDEQVAAPADHLAVALPEGRYFARLWASDRDGLRGPTGATAPLRVVRASLPAGGFMPEPGVLVVPRGRELRLLDAAGLELSVDGRGFRPAPAQVPGPARARHRLRLRIAGAAATSTAFSLERRALRAEVSLSPALPVWPDDTIEVAVKLVDPTGRVDPATVTPRLAVRVGGGAIPTEWTKHGGRWVATIDGRAVAGPRLLQVEASDANGIPLGWGFVEVVRRAASEPLAAR